MRLCFLALTNIIFDRLVHRFRFDIHKGPFVEQNHTCVSFDKE